MIHLGYKEEDSKQAVEMKSGSNRYRDLSDAGELKKFRDNKDDDE